MDHQLIEWFEAYSDDLYGWAYYKTSSKEVAEDLVQDTFLSAAKGKHGFNNQSSAKTWLFSILNNKIVDHYRGRAKKQRMAEEIKEKEMSETIGSFFVSDGSWSSLQADNVDWHRDRELWDNPDFVQTMNSCMADLPDHWRSAISFKYLFNKKSKEICQELGVTQSNYWQIIHRAKLFLRDCLNKLQGNWRRSN